MTNRQIAFVDYYISNNFNASKAAIAAGYSKKTARFIGQENLTKPDIKKAVSKRIGELLSDTDKASMEIITILDEINSGDIGDYMSIEDKTVINQNTGEEETYQTVVFKPTANLNTRIISEISQNKDGTIKIKLYDKLKAAEMKGKFLELWQDGITQYKKETKKEQLTKEQRKEEILRLSKEIGINK